MHRVVYDSVGSCADATERPSSITRWRQRPKTELRPPQSRGTRDRRLQRQPKEVTCIRLDQRDLAFPRKQAMRTFTPSAHDHKPWYRRRSWLLLERGLVRCTMCTLVLLLSACTGDTHLSFLDPQGPVADAQRWHFYEVLTVMAVLVAAPIFLLLPFFAWRYRYGKTGTTYTPRWDFSWLFEITAWTGPIVIVAVLAFFVLRDTRKLDPYRSLASDQVPLLVQVIGYDWKWLFIYPEQGIASIGELDVPAGRPISLRITSATVMQSFFIPALGSQIYAMGGMVTHLNLEASNPGKFRGENTMYNGDGFHQQQFTTIAMSPANFEMWVKHVRASGIPFHGQTFQLISQRATQSDLIAALPRASTMDGHVYFTGVSQSLFAAVVKTTMDGARNLPNAAFGEAGLAPKDTKDSAKLAATHKR
jgi:cytochrome o ubiquinol oxidase subunit 2